MLALTGTGLALTNRVHLVDPAVPCADAGLVSAGALTLPAEPRTAVPTPVGRFNLGLLTEGPVPSASRVCWAHDPSGLADFKVRQRGCAPTCVSGVSGRAAMSGVLMVMDQTKRGFEKAALEVLHQSWIYHTEDTGHDAPFDLAELANRFQEELLPPG